MMMIVTAGVLLVWALGHLLGPTAAVLWRRRRDLSRAAWLRVRHPRWWAEEKAAMKASGEWL